MKKKEVILLILCWCALLGIFYILKVNFIIIVLIGLSIGVISLYMLYSVIKQNTIKPPTLLIEETTKALSDIAKAYHRTFNFDRYQIVSIITNTLTEESFNKFVDEINKRKNKTDNEEKRIRFDKCEFKKEWKNIKDFSDLKVKGIILSDNEISEAWELEAIFTVFISTIH